ncbi:5-formaminoimidazole-4-carboxamide-1-(beta)-D-ribofuranosyl 5'-monophosphate synthetase [Candidatus Gugararchaeum adminiculabundum]|nr:5-formaminoimidazole-4-carboxamide-1-(beta)-D-ribofuranosyl 5'-monophosphate synthetase [Candidatus Gugararchaeum adminiculabundum]
MISKDEIDATVKKYEKKGKFAIATVCSHTALQIFHGARQEKVKTIGICTEDRKKVYESFPYGAPDEFIIVDDVSEIPTEELLERNAVLIPHGSLVEYVAKKITEIPVPILGNRKSLEWEGDRKKLYEWMKDAGLETPEILQPYEIDRPCIVKTPGAKGGKGYVIVKNQEEFEQKVKTDNVVIQEYLIGVRAYPHYFYTPLTKDGYRASEGSVELMSVDRRVESNVDESYRTQIALMNIEPSFTVMGNESLVLRESLLGEVLEMGKGVVESAEKLFGGIPGPFCIETVVDENLQFFAFEISARIVAGTNLFTQGSPYTDYKFGEPMSTGRRIAREIKLAMKNKKMEKIFY